MEILHATEHKQLLSYLTYVKMNMSEWLFVNIRLKEQTNQPPLSADRLAELIQGLFKNTEGKLYLEGPHEILMVVHWGTTGPATIVANDISKALPEKGYEVFVREVTETGLAKLEILISYKDGVNAKDAIPLSFATFSPAFCDIRSMRCSNVIMIADDDMYMRSLVRSSVGKSFTIVEVGDGSEVLAAYERSIPDIVFLDIHLPNKEGTDLLQHILVIDPKAYVIMLSADSSRENVETTMHQGAKGFLTKPFTQGKLKEYLSLCPTIS